MMLHQNASAEALGFVRIGVFSIWLGVLLWTPPVSLAHLPVEWFDRSGVYLLLPRAALGYILHPMLLTCLYAISIALTSLCILGIRPFWPVALLAVITGLLHDTLFKGFSGFVNHAQIGTLLAMTLLIAFPAADGMSVLGPRRPRKPGATYSTALISIAAVLAVPYALIASNRIANGGLSIFFNDTILANIAVRTMDHSSYDFRAGLIALQVPAMRHLLKAGFFITTIFELLTPLCLISHRLRRIWLLVIVPFHVTTLLTMNIFFWENVLLILLVFTNLPHWLSTMLSRSVHSNHDAYVHP